MSRPVSSDRADSGRGKVSSLPPVTVDEKDRVISAQGNREHGKEGYTMVEVLIVLAILAFAAMSVLPFLGYFQHQQTLTTVEQDLMQALRRAQHRAVIAERDSAWGVFIQARSFTTYAGTSYATRNSAFDKTESLSSTFLLTGMADIPFTKLTGIPGATGTITITETDSAKSLHIDINGQGGISLREKPSAPPQGTATDLSIDKTGPDSVNAGKDLTYDLTVTNISATLAQGITVTDPVPAQVTFKDVIGGSVSCSLQGNGSRVACTLPDITAGHQLKFKLRFTAPAKANCIPATLLNTATVSSQTLDSDQSNNVSGTVSTSLQCS